MAYIKQQEIAAKKKNSKKDKAAADRELALLLGEGYTKPSKKDMKKKKEEKAKKEEEMKKKQEAQDAIDLAIPVTTLQDVKEVDSKVIVPRVCAVLIHKDNLPTKLNYIKEKGGNCILIKISDGSTLNPMIVTVPVKAVGDFKFKVDQVLDIRNAMAMVREGGLVRLEVINEGGGRGEDAEPATIAVCSERLSAIVLEKKQTWEEIRMQGGIPLEQLIEQKRAQLKGEGTKITEESFAAWKKRKKEKQEKQRQKEADAAARKQGSKRGAVMTGRQLFMTNKHLFKDDSNAAEASEVEDNTPTVPSLDDNDDDDDDDDDDDILPAPPSKNLGDGGSSSVENAALTLKEDLYIGDDDDDLDDLDDLDDD